ncbi:AAA-domain-containing protein [Durotheca rogersii]|uniref:AAA-domain-containing protein n=1 Tax=Durotheca rogersii TaxID=419775 RepID=UPI00221F83F5|nr:AAA-domain-containing protein [Durotheca rogersii]KAI5855557.1 AAA-domain-containing protein [Durotheca rogersii]
MIESYASAGSHRAPILRMRTLSTRAFRSAAFIPLKPQQLGTHPGRFFHSSPVTRASGQNNSGSRNDEDNPEKENGTVGGEDGFEDLSGENGTAANEEGQGRKKPSSRSLRARALRSRRAQEFPPLSVPMSFLSTAVRHFKDGEPNTQLDLHVSGHGKGPRILLKRVPFSKPSENPREGHSASLFDAAAWTEGSLNEAVKTLESDPEGRFILKRGDALIAASFWAVAHLARKVSGEEAAATFLESSSVASSADFLKALLYAKAAHDNPLLASNQAQQLIDELITDARIEASGVSLYPEELIEEIVTSVNADFIIQAPENVKAPDMRRPITIINTPDCSSYLISRDILQHVAVQLGADILHMRACDIAHIIGCYLGQDIVRAPGVVSRLGYKAAENSGKLKVSHATDEDGGELGTTRLPDTIVVRDERPKKDNKRYTSLMDNFLNGSSRGKGDGVWEDLKINTALEELVHSADSDSAEQRPLIVHVDDFNALSLDAECGAMIVGKIRKVVDGLWADGRKIVLVGSCSTKGAPRLYLSGLRRLEAVDRVVTLRANSSSKIVASLISYWETETYIRENEENIVRMLSTLVEQTLRGRKTPTSSGLIGMTEIDPRKLPESWTNSILPVTEVYRIATIMIGNSKDPINVFSIEALKKAARVIRRLELLKTNLSSIGSLRDSNQQKEPRGFVDVRESNDLDEDHEERLRSGLVNAEDIRTTFKDIHAPSETIESIKMLTTLSLIHPEAFSYGVLATDRIPGCLLYGPPGTGKTLLAKAVAKESGANMIEVSGASINNMYVGESEKNVRALFGLAKKKEPMVIFIDEADALLGARGRRDVGARRETINQFLREWDGMDKTKAFIMVATNRPFDLDEAVLRRLPRKLLIDLPLERDRAAILRIHLKEEVLEESLSVDEIARRTPLYSGSDLKNVCVAAAMAAVKEDLGLELQQGTGGRGAANQGYPERDRTRKIKKRVLGQRHFDKALREIGASVSEDMATLTAIRKFDEKYGDGGAGRRRRRGMGFEVARATGKGSAVDTDVDVRGARVRNGQ